MRDDPIMDARLAATSILNTDCTLLTQCKTWAGDMNHLDYILAAMRRLSETSKYKLAKDASWTLLYNARTPTLYKAQIYLYRAVCGPAREEALLTNYVEQNLVATMAFLEVEGLQDDRVRKIRKQISSLRTITAGKWPTSPTHAQRVTLRQRDLANVKQQYLSHYRMARERRIGIRDARGWDRSQSISATRGRDRSQSMSWERTFEISDRELREYGSAAEDD